MIAAPGPLVGITRRSLLAAALTTGGAALLPFADAAAQSPRGTFDQWLASLRVKARARGISDATFTRTMNGLKPDMSVFDLFKNQPEFHEQLWQYLNRRVSDWRISLGQERAKQYAPLFDRLERDYGVDRYIMLGLWGMESVYGDPLVQKNHMRPTLPALAALAWAEPRRRSYWEKELLNALIIVQRGWSDPQEMNGSWAGAMGHTQWMPEVWLNVGIDYDGDGRISPFGKPDDALAGTARYLIKRGNYQRGEDWGYEVRLSPQARDGKRSYAAWAKLGVKRADGKDYPHPNASARLWVPVHNGPAFLLGTNFYAVRSYNPSMNYSLAIAHLGDRIKGGGPFIQPFPGGERAPTLDEVQEIQRRLTALGFDTAGTDGRIGTATMTAVQKYQRKIGMTPADGYAGVKLLQRLRQGR